MQYTQFNQHNKNNNTDSRISPTDARYKTKKCTMKPGTYLGSISYEGEIWIKSYRQNKCSGTNRRRITDDEIDSKKKHISMHERIQN